MERVTGVGGVFFRATDKRPSSSGGVPVDEGYVVFPESRDTHWVPFWADTDYWPAEKKAMVNFTVSDLDAMLAQLRAVGVEVDESSRTTSSAASGGRRTRRDTASSSGSPSTAG